MLSDDIAAAMHKAVDLAESPGKCQYESQGKPCCVVGQFAVLRGIGLSKLVAWDDTDSSSVGALKTDGFLRGTDLDDRDVLYTLKRLQETWDADVILGAHLGGFNTKIDERRKEMHAIVDEETNAVHD